MPEDPYLENPYEKVHENEEQEEENKSLSIKLVSAATNLGMFTIDTIAAPIVSILSPEEDRVTQQSEPLSA